MPFNIADIYTTSGDATLFNSWTTPVTKFDPSSFYNWEQDNEPIHDLEERTYMNWEHAGFHTSTVPGMVFTVSGAYEAGQGPPAATLAANPNIFLTVSAAIEALPSDIRFPILIEVANFGDLGHLNLKGIKIGYGGSLEIINRNFSRAYAVSGGVTGGDHNSCEIAALQHSVLGQDKYSLAAGVSSLDSSSIWANSSAVHIATPVLSGTADIRLTNNVNSVYQPFVSGTSNSRLSVAINASPSSVANHFLGEIFEHTTAQTNDPHNTASGYDVSARDLLSAGHGEIILNNGTAATDPAQGMMYGNYAKGMEVVNCNGPIYIRNFFINSNDHASDGVKVFNTNDVWLENCTSINNKVGFNFSNSKVYVNRGIVAYRNYGMDENLKRNTGFWADCSSISNTEAAFADDGAGLKAVNSEIILNTASSIYARQGAYQSTLGAFEYEVFPMEFMVNFSRNSFGVSLDNSVIRGGWAGKTSQDTHLSSINFNVELSDAYGIHARNSVIDLDGRLKLYSNSRGALLENSKAVINECSIIGNQHEGIHAINSNIQYNKNLQKLDNEEYSTFDHYQFDFSGNGRHLVLDQGSTFVPTVASAMPSKYGQMRFMDHHGITASSVAHRDSRILSPVVVKNNSKATLVHPIIKSFSSPDNLTNTVASGQPMLGECLSVTNNSEVLLQGSKNGATVIFGSVDSPLTHIEAYLAHKNSAGVYVDNNSKVECNGPTAMFNFGVDVLAENNSTINFNPPKAHETGGLDTSGWDLSAAANHTSVELHSTNTCLVAKNNSNINMKDLGDFNACWSGTNRTYPDYDTGPDGYETSGLTKGGSMQFYPNPVGVEYYAQDANDTLEPVALIDNGVHGAHQSNYRFGTVTSEGTVKNYYLESQAFTAGEHFSVSSTAGGNCVRAMGGSNVDVLNVNFPAGWWNPSGLIYDISGAEAGAATDGSVTCNRLFIWNIADNSRLHAAFCSVSGQDPRICGYNGPSSVYADKGHNGYYGAPSGTADTSTLSVLDFYGQSPGGASAIWPIPQISSVYSYGQGAAISDGFMSLQLSAPSHFVQYGTSGTTLENRGPFRLYVSVDSMVNNFSSLETSGGRGVLLAPYSDDGMHRQIYAQGYNLSGDVSAGPTTVSSTYGNALLNLSVYGRDTVAGQQVSSLAGFVYNNQVVDPTTHNRILLDESAAHTFANAKNGAMGTSNRSKICKIYVSRRDYRGEEDWGEAAKGKSRGRGYTSPDVFDIERITGELL